MGRHAVAPIRSSTALAAGALAALAVLAMGAAPAARWPSPQQAEAVRRPVPGAVVERFDAPRVVWDPGSRGAKLAAAEGEPVRAALAGTVSFAGEVAGERWVTVEHGGGLDTTYGVLDPTVPVGRAVAAGDIVGTVVADSDRAHWGARLEGEYIDPLSLLEPWRPRLVALGR